MMHWRALALRRRDSAPAGGVARLLPAVVLATLVLAAGPAQAQAPRPGSGAPGEDAARAAVEAELARLRAEIAREQARMRALGDAASGLPASRAEPPEPAATGQPGPKEADAAPPPPGAAPADTGAVVYRDGPPPEVAEPPARMDEARGPAPAPRVFIHHREAGPAARALADALRRDGFEVADIRPVPATPSAREIRYFHAGDVVAAGQLLRHLGDAGWRLRDFRHYPVPPRQGTLEVWLPDPPS